MQIVQSQVVGQGKWEKCDFNFNAFQKDRMAKMVDGVRKSRGLEPAKKETSGEQAPAPVASEENQTPANSEE